MRTLFAYNINFLNEALASIDQEDAKLSEVKLTAGGLRVSWVDRHGSTGNHTFTESYLIETHFNHLAKNDGNFKEKVKKYGVVFPEYYKALNQEIKIMEEANQNPDYKILFTELLEMMCDGRIPFKTESDIKSQKNENAKRNKKKTEEKKDNSKPLPDPTEIDDTAIKAGGVEIPGENPQDSTPSDVAEIEEIEELPKNTAHEKEEAIKVPKGFKRTKEEIKAGLTAEVAFIARQGDGNETKTGLDWI